MKRRLSAAIALFLLAWLPGKASASALFSVAGQTQGPSPFIVNLTVDITSPTALDHIDFKIEPKPGSSTRPVFVRYSATYLRSRGYLNTNGTVATVPVFGLYANYTNSVVVSCGFADQTSARRMISIATPPWNDTTNTYQTPTVVQARGANQNLSYDFIMLKPITPAYSPIIIDTDGAVRWVGTAGLGTISVTAFQNGIYLSNNSSGVIRMEWDGTYKTIGDYSAAPYNVTSTAHHQIDPGKTGLILDVNTTQWTECVEIEIDGQGNVLNSWNFANILSGVMTAGGDNPNNFIYGSANPSGSNDWFHNNASCYWPEDDSLVVSSRENFVMCIDYSTGKLKWLFGDPTKYWYQQFPSLQKYALTYDSSKTAEPIGQHAVSIYRNRLLLYDDGYNSNFGVFTAANEPGFNRGFSAPRKYFIDTSNPTSTSPGTVTEIWNYLIPTHNYDFVTDSAYEDGSQCYLFDYACDGMIMGLDTTGAVAFQYQYNFPGNKFIYNWNSLPIHLENMRF